MVVYDFMLLAWWFALLGQFGVYGDGEKVGAQEDGVYGLNCMIFTTSCNNYGAFGTSDDYLVLV